MVWGGVHISTHAANSSIGHSYEITKNNSFQNKTSKIMFRRSHRSWVEKYIMMGVVKWFHLENWSQESLLERRVRKSLKCFWIHKKRVKIRRTQWWWGESWCRAQQRNGGLKRSRGDRESRTDSSWTSEADWTEKGTFSVPGLSHGIPLSHMPSSFTTMPGW